MASRANIYIDKGTDFRTTIELFDEDDQELFHSTYNFYSGMKKLYSDASPVATFSIEKTANNDVTIILSDTQTAALKPGKYQYDVIMEKTTGELTKIVEGLAIVVDTITEVS